MSNFSFDLLPLLKRTPPDLLLSLPPLRYGTLLKKARALGFVKSFFSSLSLGSLYIIIFSAFGLGFW